MNNNLKKEDFSIAYIKAIASVAGYSCWHSNRDNQSIDIIIKNDKSFYGQLEVQLKSTAQHNLIKDNFINFPLPIKNYDDLRCSNTTSTRILVVLLLPEDDPKFWIIQDKEKLSLMKCAYWVNLIGHHETSNNTTVNVQIPLENILTPESLKLLIKSQEDNLVSGYEGDRL